VKPHPVLPGYSVRPLADRPVRLFSVDVEEWYHSNFKSAPALDAARLPRRASFGVERCIEALDAGESRGTFFVLGEIADEQPDIVRRIADAGHEVACHAFSHTLLYQQTPDAVLADLVRARELLQDLSGQPVWGFRAPSWSITTRNPWALDKIAEAGFRYDSSLFPAANYLYGVDGALPFPHRLRTPGGGELLEIPPSTLGLGKCRFGVGGGLYLRALPLAVHRFAMQAALRQGSPFLLYVHPREMDPASWSLELPLDWKERLLHGTGLRRGAARAHALLRLGGWKPLESLLDDA